MADYNLCEPTRAALMESKSANAISLTSFAHATASFHTCSLKAETVPSVRLSMDALAALTTED